MMVWAKVRSVSKIAVTLIPMIGLLVIVNHGKSAGRAPRLALSSSFCPYQTPEQWQQFLETAADNKKWIETCEDSSCDFEYYEFVKEKVQAVFEACATFMSHHEEIAKCTKNMRNFTPTWLKQHDEVSYGFTVDNHTYLTDQEASHRPKGMMTPPDQIVAALPNLGLVEAAARNNGWKYLTHDSALGGFRTFVIVSDPEGKYDQWMLLNLKEGQSSITENTPMSLITVQKKDAGGNALSKIQIHFRDYNIQHHHGRYKLVLNEMGNGKCYSCHTNGMRQLIARRTPILASQPVKGESGYDSTGLAPAPPDFAYHRLMEFNKKIRSYGSPDWNGRVIPEHHGPALGKELGCIDCHDGKSRGVLNLSTSHVQLAQKVLHELSMPPDTHLMKWLERRQMRNPELSSDEEKMLDRATEVHQDLTHQFEESRFPSLKKWFLETPCRLE